MAAQRTQADHDQDRDEEQQRQPGVGALLRASRLRCGEELRDIAELLCIRYLYLEAIEAGRYHDLPGTTYAIGFIRAYAEHLGLDSEEVVRRFKAEQSSLGRQDELAFPTPVPESGIPKGAIVFVGLIVAGLAYGAWYLSSSEEGGLADLIGPLPDRLESLVSGGDGSQPAAPDDGAPTEPASETADATAAQPETQPEPQSEMTTASPETVPSDASLAPTESADAPAAEDAAPMASPTDEAPASTAGQASDAPAASPAPGEPAETTAAVPAETDAPAAEQPTTASPETATDETTASVPEAPASAAESNQPPAEPGSSEPEAGTPAPVAETSSPVPETAATPTPGEDTTPEPTTETAASPEPEPAPAETATAEMAPAAPAPTAPASEPAPQNTASQDTAPPPAPAEEPAETASAPAEQAAAGDDNGILIRAVDNSWVQIRDADSNETVVTRLLRAGEQITVEGRPGLMLATGNAGGLEIVVDGKVVPSIGGPGTVRRNVALDVERLKTGTALP